MSDLCAGITPPHTLDSSYADMGYLLQPVDAVLTFLTAGPGVDTVPLGTSPTPSGPHLGGNSVPSEPGSVPLGGKSDPSGSSGVPSPRTSSDHSGGPKSPALGPKTTPDLSVNLELKSEFQIKLTPPKLVQLVNYSRTFISFVWNVATICYAYLGGNAPYITNEKLTQGLNFLNSVLNPSTTSAKLDIFKKDYPGVRGMRKGSGKVSSLLTRFVGSIRGPSPRSGGNGQTDTTGGKGAGMIF